MISWNKVGNFSVYLDILSNWGVIGHLYKPQVKVIYFDLQAFLGIIREAQV
ncbi:MAG: hypothetical protein WA919_13410 [Coleofasciculaceae cyanobacterium]